MQISFDCLHQINIYFYMLFQVGEKQSIQALQRRSFNSPHFASSTAALVTISTNQTLASASPGTCYVPVLDPAISVVVVMATVVDRSFANPVANGSFKALSAGGLEPAQQEVPTLFLQES